MSSEWRNIMTEIQKQAIKTLRGSGLGYKKIAQMLELPAGTVQSFCRRENIPMVEPIVFDDDHCRECGKPLNQRVKIKRRKFCSDECRIKWWSKHPCAKNANATASNTVICKHCGKPFSAYGKAPRKYCSHACYEADRFRGGRR